MAWSIVVDTKMKHRKLQVTFSYRQRFDMEIWWHLSNVAFELCFLYKTYQSPIWHMRALNAQYS